MISGDNKIAKTRASSKIPMIRDRYATIHTGHNVSLTLKIKTAILRLKNEIRSTNFCLRVWAVWFLPFFCFLRLLDI